MKLIPFILFVIAMTGTPGPGNLTMLGIGQATGFRSAIPFLIGTTVGCFLLNLSVAFGLGAFVTESVKISYFMKIFGMGYMIWLGFKVIKLQIEAKEIKKQFTFFEGFLIHPTSPKSWAMSVIAINQFADPTSTYLTKTVVFVLCFLIGQVTFHSLWCAIGSKIISLLRTQKIRVAFNVITAFMMVGTTAYALFI
ncbi:MAG: LysE family translocator [Desulfobacterales bacterium]|nr:LysE family translocator [Desulfobacterales bacterium]MCP4158746.1 LysE family translocator [Deltaproteobacteria bacterium]